MGRAVTARLDLEINDAQIDAHLAKVREVKAEWAAIGAQFDSFDGQKAGALQGLMTSLATAFGKVSGSSKGLKFDVLHTAMLGIDSVLVTLNPKVDAFGGLLSGLAPSLERVAQESKKWASAMAGLNTSLGGLEKKLESLIDQQQKVDTHITAFAGSIAQVNAELKQNGQELLRVIQQFAAFNKATEQASTNAKRAKDSTNSWWDSIVKLERGFIRHSTVLFILQHQIEDVLRAFTDAAAGHDLEVVLSKSISGFSEKMKEAQYATRGTIAELELLKSAALMSSFGLDMSGSNFARNMEVVQKLAIRTGQDAKYLADSLARGVSRLSPAILDNLGLQIKLKDAYEAYASSVGKATTQLTAQEKKTATLNEVLRQGIDLTSEVDPASSYMARVQQAQARITDFFTGIKNGILGFFINLTADIDERIGMTMDKVAIRIKEMREGVPFSKLGGDTVIDDPKVLAALSAVNAIPMTLREAWDQNLDYVNLSITGLERLRDAQRAIQIATDANRRFGTDDSKSAVQQLEELKGIIAQKNIDIERAQSDTERNLLSASQGLTQIKYTTALKNFESLWEAYKKIDEVQKGLKTQATSLFSDAPSQAAWISRMQSDLDSMRDEQLKLFGQISALPAGVGTRDDVQNKINAAQGKNVAIQRESTLQWQIANRAVQQQVDLLDTSLERLKMMAGTAGEVGEAEFSLAQLKKEISKEQAAYDQLRAKWEERTGEVQQEQLEQQGHLLQGLYMRAAQQEAMVSLEKEFLKALNDTSVLSKDLKKTEAERLAHDRGRAELEKEYIQLRLDHANAVAYLTEATGHYYEMLATGGALEAAAAQQDVEMAQQKLEQLKRQIIDNRNFLASMPKGGGGGRIDRGDKPDDLKTRPDTVDQMSIFRAYFGANDVTIEEISKEIRSKFDVLGQVISKEVTKLEENLTVFGLILPAIGSGIDGYQDALQKNEETLNNLTALTVKYTEAGQALDPALKMQVDKFSDLNIKMRTHIDLLKEMQKVAVDTATGIQNAFVGGKDLIGADWLSALDGLQTGLTGFAEALGKTTDGYELLMAGLPAIRGFTNAFIKDLKTRAFFEMLMNAAAAWAAYPNVPKMTAHGTAAILYGMVAGGAVKLPSKATKESTTENNRTEIKQAPINVYISGEMIMSEGQLGATVQAGVQQARAEGRL